MNKCSVPGNREEPPNSYSLSKLATKNCPENFDDLLAWLQDKTDQESWFGKLYVAATITWDDESKQFYQKGCGPNYQAGWWSLACCKHRMRTVNGDFDKRSRKETPFVFTLASMSPFNGKRTQALVSVAKVTYPFTGMNEYADFLINRVKSERLISSRLTREPRLPGRRFGDCHADLKGRTDPPLKGHVHEDREGYERDLKRNHLILVSGPNDFLLWVKPQFAASYTIHQEELIVTANNLKDSLTGLA